MPPDLTNEEGYAGMIDLSAPHNEQVQQAMNVLMSLSATIIDAGVCRGCVMRSLALSALANLAISGEDPEKVANEILNQIRRVGVENLPTPANSPEKIH